MSACAKGGAVVSDYDRLELIYSWMIEDICQWKLIFISRDKSLSH